MGKKGGQKLGQKCFPLRTQQKKPPQPGRRKKKTNAEGQRKRHERERRQSACARSLHLGRCEARHPADARTGPVSLASNSQSKRCCPRPSICATRVTREDTALFLLVERQELTSPRVSSRHFAFSLVTPSCSPLRRRNV